MRRGLIFLAALAACAGPTRRWSPAVGPAPGDPPLETVFRLPLARARVLSPFGPRRGKLHTGIDLLQTRGGGDPVFAAASGRVLRAEPQGRYGRAVVLEHGDGYRTRYAHLKRILASPGRRVAAGEKIGVVGRTGRATTAHLHFEVIAPSGRFLDPAPLIFRARPAPSSGAGSKK